MKEISFLIVIHLISCSNHTEKQESSIDLKKISLDSVSAEPPESDLNKTIDEPFQVSDIPHLEFTSGGGMSINKNKFCDTISNGFFGTYFLIDSDFADETRRPVGGTIIVHVHEKMSGWRADDTTQIIWEIHLKSDVISVWNSVKVGMPRTQAEKFCHENNGFYVRNDNNYYTCDFNNFSAVYLFQDDTLKELTVTRKCVK